MDASALSPDTPLPADVPTLHGLLRELLAEQARLRQQNAELLAEVKRLRQENAQLKGKLEQAARHRFGKRSERRPRAQSKEGKPAPKRDRHGQSPLPEHLERRDEVHDLTEAEKVCPCCGRPRLCIGTQQSEQLDMEPARFFVRRILKKTYACQNCDKDAVPAEQRIATADPGPAGPLPGSRCGPGLLAHLITAKFADHTPLHRLAGQLARCGVELADSTLGDWVARAAALLRPLYELMRRQVLLSRVIHSDDTPVKLRVPGARSTAKAHLRVYIGDPDQPYVVFDFTADYTKEGPQRVLKGYKGYLQADALAQYEGLFGPEAARHCCCWAHARRKFVAAADGGDERAEVPLELIGRLYGVEEKLPALLPPSEEPAQQEQRRQREGQRRQARQEQAKPILDTLKKWLEEERPKVLPKSPLGVAIGYALNNWEALCRYVEEGYLAIDNNKSERVLRVVAVGRNNWGVLGSETGGESAAVLYSVVQTCRHLGLDPFAYLQEALPGIFALG